MKVLTSARISKDHIGTFHLYLTWDYEEVEATPLFHTDGIKYAIQVIEHLDRQIKKNRSDDESN